MFIVLSSHFCTSAAFYQPFNKRILYRITSPTCWKKKRSSGCSESLAYLGLNHSARMWALPAVTLILASAGFIRLSIIIIIIIFISIAVVVIIFLDIIILFFKTTPVYKLKITLAIIFHWFIQHLVIKSLKVTTHLTSRPIWRYRKL